jgi:hypothetical protein
MNRVHELVVLPGKKSRLTITPLRVTVKVSQEHKELEAELVEASQRIAESVTLDRTLRGCFDVRNRRITLYTKYPALMMTYDFEGNML